MVPLQLNVSPQNSRGQFLQRGRQLGPCGETPQGPISGLGLEIYARHLLKLSSMTGRYIKSLHSKVQFLMSFPALRNLRLALHHYCESALDPKSPPDDRVKRLSSLFSRRHNHENACHGRGSKQSSYSVVPTTW